MTGHSAEIFEAPLWADELAVWRQSFLAQIKRGRTVRFARAFAWEALDSYDSIRDISFLAEEPEDCGECDTCLAAKKKEPVQ